MTKKEKTNSIISDNLISHEHITSSKYISVVIITNMVAHFISILYTTFVVYTATPGSTLFSWHPTLMAVAFALFCFEGIIVFSPESSLYHRCSRYQKRVIHWVLMGVGNVCATVGVAVVYVNKNAMHKPHFETWHGMIGLYTWLYGLFQLLGGFTFIQGMWLPGVSFARQKAYHATSGMVMFSMVCLSMWLGMWSNWFTREVTGTSWLACLVCPMIMALVTMSQITRAYLPAHQRPV